MNVWVGLGLVMAGIVIGAAIARLLFVNNDADLRSELEEYRKKYERLCEENITLKAVTNWEVDDGNEQSPDYFKPF